MDLVLKHPRPDTLDQDAHAVMMCDGAGWHDERALTVPDNVTLANRLPVAAFHGLNSTPSSDIWL